MYMIIFWRDTCEAEKQMQSLQKDIVKQIILDNFIIVFKVLKANIYEEKNNETN